MQTRTLVTSAVAIASLVAGAALARSVNIIHGTSNVSYRSAAVSTASPAVQSTATYVFACVNKSGKIDYLEFRAPLPHQCWFSGESLWHLAAVPAIDPTPSPSASSSPSPTPTPSPSTSSSSPAPSSPASPSASASQSSPAPNS
jgi:hypothetical protein